MKTIELKYFPLSSLWAWVGKTGNGNVAAVILSGQRQAGFETREAALAAHRVSNADLASINPVCGSPS